MLTKLERSNIFPHGSLDLDVSTSDVVNIIFTRFFLVNFRMGKFKEDFDEYKYLEYRCDLFLKICYPSVIPQLSSSDKWYLFVSPQFIDFVKEKLGNIDERVIIQDFNKEKLIKEIDGYILSNKLPCITRIDNDDTLSLEYIELVDKVSKKLSEKNDYAFVMFPVGLQKNLSLNDCNLFVYNITHTFTVFYKTSLEKNLRIWLYNFEHTKLYESDINVVINNTNLPMWSENISDTNQANYYFKDTSVKVNLQSPVMNKLFPVLLSYNS